MPSKHWPKLPYTNTREVHLKVCSIDLGRNVFGQPYAMCLSVMYFNKIQSVCEGKLGAWGFYSEGTSCSLSIHSTFFSYCLP